jgi:hypothetical protein
VSQAKKASIKELPFLLDPAEYEDLMGTLLIISPHNIKDAGNSFEIPAKE